LTSKPSYLYVNCTNDVQGDAPLDRALVTGRRRSRRSARIEVKLGVIHVIDKVLIPPT